MKRITFSFSLEGATLGSFLAQHSDSMNIQVHDEPERRGGKGNGALVNGHALKMLEAPTGGRADPQEVIMQALANGPLRAGDLKAAIIAACGGSGSAVYSAASKLIDARKVKKDGVLYSLTAGNEPPKTGADLIMSLMHPGAKVTLKDMRAAFISAKRSPKSLNSQLAKVVGEKKIKNVGKGLYQRT